MSETLYPYYERELVFIRQMAQDFARRYPAAAGRLMLEPNRSTDPHVERMIEAFALLAGRVQHKIDDEFPELTEALLNVLYPHYLSPIPSLGVVQLDLDPTRTKLPNGFNLPRSSKLRSQPVNGIPCRFQTCYPVTLWPVAVRSAELIPPPFPTGLQPPSGTAAVLVMRLECEGGLSFSELSLHRLRFHLNGETHVVGNLYELLCNHVTQVLFRPVGMMARQKPFTQTPRQALHQAGFEPEEGLLPYPRRSFQSYRLLTELFAFPSKFWFVDLAGFDRARHLGYERDLEVIFFLNRNIPSIKQAVEAGTFCLGCTPVVNLFEQVCEPIALTQARFEYLITPDVTRTQGMEVYSVDSVTNVDPVTGHVTDYQPFYSFRHGVTQENQQAFWYTTRKPSLQENDRGSEVYLNLVDLRFNPKLPAESTLIVRATCTNRELAGRLARLGDQIALTLETAAPLARIRCLRGPTVPLRPALRRGAHWRLLSHLSLNHLSLSDPVEGKEALQEILRLYDFSDPESEEQLAAINRQLVEGILSVDSRRVVRQLGGPGAASFCRGIEVALELDEQKYLGTGMFLFASVLERFFGLYTSVNSFSQLVAKGKQSEGYFKRWPPRAGAQSLL